MQGLDSLRRAADAGHLQAAVEAARILIYLVSSRSALSEAVTRLEAVESAGHGEAAYLLALLAISDAVLVRDFDQLDQRILSSAKAGFAPAQRALALMLGAQPGARAQAAAVHWFGQAAAAGDVISAQLVAERLRHGEGTPVDTTAAEALDRQLEQAGASRLPSTSSHQLAADGEPESETLILSSSALLKVPAADPRCDRPRLLVYPSLLSVEECRFVIAMALPRLRRSRVFDPSLGHADEQSIRNSSDCAFDPLLEDFYLRLLQRRMALAAECELVQGEQLIVLRYLPGERYLPHRDYLSPRVLAANRPDAGQRMRTVCVYLNTVTGGGDTDFPLLNQRVDPKAGQAVVFDNLTPDGVADPDSLHAGLEVTEGEKWLATLWLRQGRYRAF